MLTIISTPQTSLNHDRSYRYQVVSDELNGDSISYQLLTAPEWLGIDPQTGLLQGTALNIFDSVEVKVQVSDHPHLNTDSQTFTIKDVITSISEAILPRVTFSPNPVSTQLSIQIKYANSFENYLVQVYNLDGSLAFRKVLKAGGQHILNFSTVSSGLKVLEIIDPNGQRLRKKLIKL